MLNISFGRNVFLGVSYVFVLAVALAYIDFFLDGCDPLAKETVFDAVQYGLAIGRSIVCIFEIIGGAEEIPTVYRECAERKTLVLREKQVLAAHSGITVDDKYVVGQMEMQEFAAKGDLVSDLGFFVLDIVSRIVCPDGGVLDHFIQV